MTIAVHQIQNVLRTYGRQLSRRDTLSRVASLGETAESGEGRSPQGAEAKRQEVISRITREIVARIAQQNGGRGSQGEEEKAALDQLSEEYGRPLQVSLEGGIETFRVVDEPNQRLVPVPEEDAEGLRQRLYELTRGIVEENMVKAS